MRNKVRALSDQVITTAKTETVKNTPKPESPKILPASITTAEKKLPQKRKSMSSIVLVPKRPKVQGSENPGALKSPAKSTERCVIFGDSMIKSISPKNIAKDALYYSYPGITCYGLKRELQNDTLPPVNEVKGQLSFQLKKI